MFNQFSPYGYQSTYDRQPMQQMQQAQAQQPQQYQNTNIVFVSGLEGARAYQLPPNSNVLLMDSENQRFYVKSTDNLGVPKLSGYVFSNEDIQTQQTQQQQVQQVQAQNTELLNEMVAQINELNAFRKNVEEKMAELL